jgi:hypothetical protein
MSMSALEAAAAIAGGAGTPGTAATEDGQAPDDVGRSGEEGGHGDIPAPVKALLAMPPDERIMFIQVWRILGDGVHLNQMNSGLSLPSLKPLTPPIHSYASPPSPPYRAP